MQPIFIVAVPRSGSTMLRLMLNAHPAIFSGEETPWLGGNYRVDDFDPEVSVRCLYQRLIAHSLQNKSGEESSQITNVFAAFVLDIVKTRLEAEGKRVWVEKTPDNIIQARFLHQIFPAAKFIRIVRDGRDVALSTNRSRDWASINYFIDGSRENQALINVRKALNRRLLFKLPKSVQEIVARTSLPPAMNQTVPGIFYPLANTYYNAMYRWQKWNEYYEACVKELGLNSMTVKYEDMLLRPRETFSQMFDFVGVGYDDRIFEYKKYQSHLKQDDLGVQSALKFSSVEPKNAYKWKEDLTSQQKKITQKCFDAYLVSAGYERTC